MEEELSMNVNHIEVFPQGAVKPTLQGRMAPCGRD